MGNIPKTYDKLLVWSLNFVSCLKANSAVLKLDSGKLSILEGLTAKYKKAYEKAMDPNHVRTDRGAKIESAKELRNYCRRIMMEDLTFNPAMNGQIEYAIRLPAQTNFRKSWDSTEKPRLVVLLNIAGVTVRYYHGGRAGKLRGARAIHLYWELRDTPPDSPEDLKHKESKTSGPFVKNFSESERGKQLYFAARWEGPRGETGSWSDVIKVFIP